MDVSGVKDGKTTGSCLVTGKLKGQNQRPRWGLTL